MMVERRVERNAAQPIEPESEPASARSPRMGELFTLPDGAVAARVGDALELRDNTQRLLIRYENGHAEVFAPEGDLRLAAPSGRVVLEGQDVCIAAERDVSVKAPRRIELGTAADTSLLLEGDKAKLRANEVSVTTPKVRIAAGEAEVLAREIRTTAERIATQVTRYELQATRIVEKAKDTFRDVTDLAQTRVGRARMIVKELFTLRARRSVIASERETKIDGSKVLLG
jgi:hypothetical protein